MRLDLTPFRLECGAPLQSLRIEAWESGPAKAPVALIVHALTGDARAGGPGGWWSPIVDTALAGYRVVCFNNLGSCYGSSGPDDPDFPRRREIGRATIERGPIDHDADSPAPITTWDQARAILLALDALSIGSIALLTGGSVGGMIAQCLAVLAPERFLRAVILASAARATPWMIGWNHLGRAAIARHNDLALARQIAHLSYRAEPGLDRRQGRRSWAPFGPYHIQSYLAHHGEKLVERFTPRAYLSQLDAMDHHDLERDPGPPESHESWSRRSKAWGLDRWRAPCLAAGVTSDALFAPEHMRALADALAARRVRAEYAAIKSEHGHDGFLIEIDQVSALLERAGEWTR